MGVIPNRAKESNIQVLIDLFAQLGPYSIIVLCLAYVDTNEMCWNIS